MKAFFHVTIIFQAISIVFASRKCPCQDKAHCDPISRPPGKEFVMFSTQPQGWKKYEWSKVTTIVLFREWDDDLMCYAHSKGVRVVLLGNYPVEMLGNRELRKEWINNMTKMALSNHADGINIDIEKPVERSSKEEALLTMLVNETTQAFHSTIKGSQVSFDVAWSPDCIDGRCYDAAGIGNSCDFLVIMSYDEQSQIRDGPCIAKANSPLNKTLEGVGEYLKLGISSDKLVLGLPWYGYDYPCVTIDKNDTCTIKSVPFRGANCSDAAGSQLEYTKLNDLLVSRSYTGALWSHTYQSPYFNYYDSIGGIHQVWFDNPFSLSKKYAISAEKKLRGIAIWNSDLLDYGALPRGRQETQLMWEALKH